MSPINPFATPFAATAPTPTPSDPQAVIDAAIEGFQTNLQKHYALPITPAFIQAIFAAIQSVLTACIPPTPALAKAQVKRPYIRIRMRREFVLNGVPVANAFQAVEAACMTIDETSEADLKTLIAAAQ